MKLSRRNIVVSGLLAVVLVLGCNGPTETKSGGSTPANGTTGSAAPADKTADDNPPAGSNTAASGENKDNVAAVTKGGDGKSGERFSVAFVTNQIANFWNIAEKGCIDAQKDFDVDCVVKFPEEATATRQKQIVEDLLAAGIKGLAVSPIDADNQTDMLNQWAKQIPLITHDSDAPNSDRLVYIGMDNYAAGRMTGALVKKAFPNGAKLCLFIGRLEQDNAQKRRQGVIDELLGRPVPATGSVSFDPVDGVIESEQFTIYATFTDQGKADVAKQKAEDAINAYPEMNCMVGLFEYNPPAIIQALRQSNKLNQIMVVGFDENSETLQGIKEGHVVGTVVQNPYEYGYKSVEVLAKLIRGDKSVIPASKYIDIAPRAITKENVDEFWADLRAKSGSN